MNKGVKIGLFLLLLLWCAGFFAEFLVPFYNKIVFLLPNLKKNYSLLCHQNPQKVITLGVYSTFVCARCAGIYIGAFAASAVNIFTNRRGKVKTKFFILTAIPMFLDALFTTLRLYPYSRTLAFLTGFLFGVVTFFYFYNALLELITEIRERRK